MSYPVLYFPIMFNSLHSQLIKRMTMSLLSALIFIPATFSASKVEINGLNFNLDSDSGTTELTFQYQESTSNYSALSAINVPETVEYDGVTYTVTSIGPWALNRVKTSSISLPATLKSIGKESMAVISNVKELIIPDGVSDIGDNAFMRSDIERLILPDSLSSLAYGVCAEMEKLKFIRLGKKLSSIGGEAFNYTYNIDTIECHAVNPPVLISGRSSTFTSSVMSSAVLLVPEESINAYSSNSDWKSFNNIRVLEDPKEDIENDSFLKFIFNDNDLTAELTFEHQESTLNYAQASAIEIPETITKDGKNYKVTGIGPWALNRIKASSVSIPGSVKIIRKESLARTSAIKEILIPEGVERIEDNAFMGSSIERISLPNSLKELGYGVCAEMKNLKYIRLGESLESIGGEAFNYTSHIDTIECLAPYPPKFMNGRGPSFTSSTLESAVLLVPDEYINTYARHSVWGKFKNIKPAESKILSSDKLPVYDGKVLINQLYYYLYPETRTATVTYQLYQDENNYRYLESILIPARFIHEGIEYTVTKVGSSAFDRCYDVNYIAIPETVTEIEKDGFCSNRSLTEVIIGDNVTAIGYGAFAYNYHLENLTIGAGVKSIGGEAFNYDTAIKNITIHATTPPSFKDWGNFSSSTYQNATLYVPAGCRSTYANADGWSDFSNIREINSLRVQIDNIWYELNTESHTGFVTYESLNSTSNYRSIERVTIPESVNYDGTYYKITAIGEHAFNHSLLSAIELPSSISEIGIAAFSNITTAIEKLIIPSSVSKIGDLAFAGSNISEIDFNDGVTDLGYGICSGMKSLKRITLGTSLKTIGNGAFQNSPAITEIFSNQTVPPTFSAESNDPFSNTVYQKATLRVPQESVDKYKSAGIWKKFNRIFPPKSEPVSYCYDGIYYLLDSEENTAAVDYESSETGKNYSSLAYKSLPESIEKDGTLFTVTAIGESAFAGAGVLASIGIPSTVTSISANAFTDAAALNSITCYATVPPVLENEGIEVFDLITRSAATLYVPAESINLYKKATGWSAFSDIQSIGSVKIGSVYYHINQETHTASTTYQVYQSAENYGKMKSVMIPESFIWDGEEYTVTGIGASSFDRCYEISYFDIPNSVTEIETDGFCSNHSLKHVVIGESVTRIGYGAFAFNYSLETLTLGSNVKTLGGEAFNYDYKLKKITCLAENPPVMEPGRSSTFSSYSYSDGVLYVPRGCVDRYKESDWNRFSDIREIEDQSVNVDGNNYLVDYEKNEASATYSEYNSRSNYQDIESLELPSSVTATSATSRAGTVYKLTGIGEHAFNHSSVRKLVIPETVKTIGRVAFANLDNLTEVIIPESVKSIGDNAFCNNKSMTRVLTGNGVDSIGYGSFAMNRSLKTVDLGKNLRFIGGESFSHCDAIEEILVRADVPPTIEDGNISAFSSRTYRTAVLYVGNDYIEDYRKADGWALFSNIRPIETYSSVDWIETPGTGSDITFGDIDPDSHITVYSVDGRMVFKGKKSSFVPVSGVYLVVSGNRTVKCVF